MTAICLVMIVRNEAAVIERCLRSVYPLISRWCIVDTGSTDNTIELVKNYLQDLPGDIYQRPWKDFGHNRTEAIDLAIGKADYNLTIDADEILEGDFQGLPEPSKDIYIARFHSGEYSYGRPIIFRNDGGFYYKGPVHEELTRDLPSTTGKLKSVTGKVFGHVSARGGNEKYLRDIELLLSALEDEPHNSRYWFYLAQSYRDSSQDREAHYFYGIRSAMKGWDEETFVALLEKAKLTEKLGFTSTDILDAYDKAFQFRPVRGAEVMYRAARYLRLHDKPGLGYSYAKTGARCHEPADDLLFVDVGAYQWKIYDEWAQCALMLPGKKTEAADIFRQLLDHGGIPEGEVKRIEQQLAEATNA